MAKAKPTTKKPTKPKVGETKQIIRVRKVLEDIPLDEEAKQRIARAKSVSFTAMLEQGLVKPDGPKFTKPKPGSWPANVPYIKGQKPSG